MARPNTYIYGNTVRKTAMPLPRPEREHVERPQERPVRRVVPQTQTRVNPLYFLFLAFALIVTVAVCALYVQLQSDINSTMKNISSLESQVLDLRTENDASIKRIETSVNLDEIKTAALNDLGMVHPSEEQIVYYSVGASDYMNQYGSIPEN